MREKLKKFWRNRAGYIAYTRKAIINFTGLATSLLTLGLLPEPTAGYVASGIGVLTMIAHYKVANASAPDDPGPIAADAGIPQNT